MALGSNQRNFPFQPTRIGPGATKYFFTVTCSRCPTSRSYESNKVVPDEVVNKFFSRGGWVLGRNRQHDICPTCLGVKPENKLAARFKVIDNGERVPSPVEMVAEAQDKRAVSRKVTEQALDRLFSKPKAVEPEVAEPAPETPQADPSAVHMIRLEKRLDTMTTEIAEVRAATELVVESVDAMTRSTQQQTEAIARAAGTIGRASEGISSMLQGLITLVKEIRDQRAPQEEPVRRPMGIIADEIVLPESGLTTLGMTEEPKLPPEPLKDDLPELTHGKLPPLEPLPRLPILPKPTARHRPRPVAPPAVRLRTRPVLPTPPAEPTKEALGEQILADLFASSPEPIKPKRKRRTQAQMAEARAAEAAARQTKQTPEPDTKPVKKTRAFNRDAKLAVYSNPDRTKSTPRFYTTISIPRRVWDLAGFGGDHRVLLYEAAGAIRIEKVSARSGEGQVIKKFTPNVVRLQTTKFGQIEVPKPTAVVEKGQIVISGIL